MTLARFGYCPQALDWKIGDIVVATLPDLPQTIDAVTKREGIEKDWIYAPPSRTRDFMSGTISVQPYSSRVFALPQTHAIEHTNGGLEQLDFLVWCLGFILGMRLTTTEAGFLDATPIKPGVLHDIVWCGRDSIAKALACADDFWRANQSRPRVPKALTGVIHSYFLAQNPIALGFERFTNLYVALEGCHFVHSTTLGKAPRSAPHRDRIAGLCSAFNMPIPSWAAPTSANIATHRNETLHEGLFFDEPLGFAGFGGQGHRPSAGLVLLEMEALVARLLVALLGMPAPSYITSELNTRQQHGVTL